MSHHRFVIDGLVDGLVRQAHGVATFEKLRAQYDLPVARVFNAWIAKWTLVIGDNSSWELIIGVHFQLSLGHWGGTSSLSGGGTALPSQ